MIHVNIDKEILMKP